MNWIDLVKLLALIAIAVASHGQGHINLEKEYGYDPIRLISKNLV